MSHKVDSPVARWPGSVTLPEYLTLPQVAAWRRAWRAAKEFTHPNGTEQLVIDDPIEYRLALLPGVLPCFEKFEFVGLPEKMTVDSFPGSPVEDAAELAVWLMGLIAQTIRGEEIIPKA